MSSLVRRTLIVSVALIEIAVLAALVLLQAAPIQAQDATGQIAFTSDRDGNDEIYVMNADGSGQTRLTENPAADSTPTWSPDGTKIAFTSNRDDPNPSTCGFPAPSCDFQIYVMDADGSNQVRITNVPGESASGPAWSHDGSRIAFAATRQGIPSISTMNPDGSGVTRVTDNPPDAIVESDFHPDWSPDDLRLVFAGLPRSGMGFTAIFTADVDGSRLGRLTRPEGLVFNADGDPAWSPDGSRIAYSSGDPGGSPEPPAIYLLNLDGSGPTTLITDGSGLDQEPAWSPDGSRIAFSRGPLDSRDIYAMNADGSGQTNLTNNPANDSDPAWSQGAAVPTPTAATDPTDEPAEPGPSAASQIAFVSDRDGNDEIYVMNDDGSGQTNLTNNPARDREPAWSPDGGRIAFVSDRDEPSPSTCEPSCNREIYVMNADGSGLTNLTSNPADESGAAWSPGGGKIAFVSDRDGDQHIFVANADGSGLINVTDERPGLFPHEIAWSPDGTRVAFTSQAGTRSSAISVVNADGSNLAQLTGVANPIFHSSPTWSPDGSRIAFVESISVLFNPDTGEFDLNIPVPPTIYVINAGGSDQTGPRPQTLLTDPSAADSAPSWSPDGTRIAFVSDRDDPNSGACEGPCDGAVYVMDADGSGQTRVTTDATPFQVIPLDWSPDGSRIAFVSGDDGDGEIYVVNADGSGQTRLTNSPANDTSPAWSPLEVAEPTPTEEPVEPTAIDDPGPPQSEFVRSVPGPGDISTDPGVVGTNIFFTLVVILVFGFTSALFNETVSNNRKDIEGWVGRFFAPFRSASNFVEQQYGAVTGGRPWVQRLAGPAVILLLTGLVYGYLSSDFDLDSQSAVLVVSMVLAVGAATYIYAGGEALFTRRVLGLDAGVKLYAVALAIAVGFVLFSRLVEFRPGFMFGFVASFTLLTPAALGRERSGQAALFPAVALLFVSLIAWVLLVPLREVDSTSSWAGLPEGTAAALVVAGLEGVFFSMIPLSFMHGARIAQWNRMLWLLMFALTGFLFWHVLLNQEGDFLEAFEETKIRVIVALLSSYFVATLAVWAYFRGRVYGWSLPALVRGQSTAEHGLRRPVALPMFLAVIAVAVTAVIAIGVLAVVSTGDGDDDSSVVVGEGTPTETALPSATPATPTIAATPTVSVAIDRSTCGQSSDLPALAQELATVRNQGYIVCDTTTYLPGGAIHVLIGVLENSSDSFTQLAFFFVGGEYLGTDSITPSASITVVSQVSNTVTLSYAMYRPGDPSCCPSADEAVVPYDWDGTRLTPRADIPATEGPVSRR